MLATVSAGDLGFAASDGGRGAAGMTRSALSEEPGERSRVDAELLQRTARGDRAAFAGLYDRFSRPLYATALLILRDAAEAEDIVQEVFLALWEKAALFERERGSAFSWAVTLTRNRAIDRLRMLRRRGELLAASAHSDLGYASPGEGGDTPGTVGAREAAASVRQAVAALPEEQRRTLELAYFGGFTQQEIATQLGEPIGTVKARIRRALIKLRDKLPLSS